MINNKKIAVFTGTRAEYGLLFQLMKRIQSSQSLDLQIIASGMHLSPEFGLTYEQIEKDGFSIDKKVEMLLSSDTSLGVVKSMGLGLISYGEALEELKPDMLVILGDRYEAFAMASACLILKVPVVHLHGGEITQGAFDESIRHAITKMSSLHFTSTEQYKKRVIQLGERPERVFNVCGLGIENIKQLDLLDRKDFEKSIDFELGLRNLLVTYHPVTLEENGALQEFDYLLQALNQLEATKIIFTMPNSDNNSRAIIQKIENYVNSNKDKACCFTSLGQLRYLSALKHVTAVIGNSSSGVIEVPSFEIGTLDIGDRQKGRIKGESVVECLPTLDSISDGLNKVLFSNYKGVANPYDAGIEASRVIVDELIKAEPSSLIRKPFYDL
jgi:GDP/UDP-N,N'-diacetylbacillosamine 2-epimerase (hydrolysing)